MQNPFKSGNYNILLSIFPELRIIFYVKQDQFKEFTIIRIFIYFKLFIIKFEVFIYDYFTNITQDTMENLYKNQSFNETLCLMSYILK
ncbi:hypothetical protein H312_02427 [Anncaliia algerae PRA339]|uniref:Uncharacterized protein n=1 Tax=Anncaliia algerae PRA339 TaxID=1288291 RepID=A0A059EZP1_9MICR|nr:hypothetical protein H312_02427 [Anncaliia algerae PRA339]